MILLSKTEIGLPAVSIRTILQNCLLCATLLRLMKWFEKLQICYEIFKVMPSASLVREYACITRFRPTPWPRPDELLGLMAIQFN